MVDEYRVYLENLSFPSFLRLIEAVRRTNESARRIQNPRLQAPNPMRPHPPPRKRLVVATVENGQGEALLPEESYLQARVLAGTQSGT